MFGDINKTDKHYNDDSNRNHYRPKINNNKSVKSNTYNDKSERFSKSRNYDETTYSVSSDDDSDESQKSAKKSQNKNKTPSVNELDLIKRENHRLKIDNEILIKLNNLTESMLKTNISILDITKEQNLLKSRLEKLEKLKDEPPKNDIQRLVKNDNELLPLGDNSLSDTPFTNNTTSKTPVNDNLPPSTFVLPKLGDKK